MDQAADFCFDSRWHDAFYGGGELDELNSWLRGNPDAWVRLYHGTSIHTPVMEKGLLPATPTRRNSYQSSNGYVCLSVYPGMSFEFGKMASLNRGADAEGNRVAVYAVTVTVRRLKADLDQLANKRMGGFCLGNSLAESLVHGSGARVRGTIDPMQISRIGTFPLDPAPDFNHLRQIARPAVSSSSLSL